jgi:excisionase family DNA binding protein
VAALDPDLLTQEEVAERLRCSPRSVARMRWSGELPFVPGAPVLIRWSDVEKWMVEAAAARREMARQWNGSSWVLPASPRIGRGVGKAGGPKGKLI